MKYNAVIFDMDGLMFATEQVNYRAFTEIVKEEGYNPTFEQYIGFLGMNAKDIQKKYYVYYGCLLYTSDAADE